MMQILRKSWFWQNSFTDSSRADAVARKKKKKKKMADGAILVDGLGPLSFIAICKVYLHKRKKGLGANSLGALCKVFS